MAATLSTLVLASEPSISANRSLKQVKLWPIHHVSHEHQESIGNATDSTQLFICHHKPHDTCATCELQAGEGRGSGEIFQVSGLGVAVLVIVATCGRGYKQSTCDWIASSHHHAAYFCVP